MADKKLSKVEKRELDLKFQPYAFEHLDPFCPNSLRGISGLHGKNYANYLEGAPVKSRLSKMLDDPENA